MPTVLPDRALANIVPIVAHLLDDWSRFAPDVQDRIEQLYATMRDECHAAQFAIQCGLAVARFLAAIDELPEVHQLVGEQIALTHGVLRRSARPMPEASVLDSLPPSLAGERVQHRSTMPPDDTQLAEALPGDTPLEALTALPGDAAAPESLGAGTAEASSTRDISSLPPAPPLPLPPVSVEDSPPPPAAAAAERSLMRYPSLDYPRQVTLGARTSLLVGLNAVGQPGVASIVVDVPAAADPSAAEPPVLEVVVRAHAFDIEESNTQLLEVPLQGDAEVRFVLVPREAGEHEIRVDFYQHGRRIGTARHGVRVAERASVAMPVRSEAVPLEPMELGGAPAVAPDLELCVEADRNDARVLYFSLHSTDESVDLHHAQAGTVRLQGSPLEKMQQVYDRLSRYAGPAPAEQNERLSQLAELERIGRNLWDELVSDELKDGYWKWKDRISSLLITTDEPWIPWEIIKPYRYDDRNRLIDEPFLCEKFVISRWLSGPGPADRVPIQYLRPVAPRVSNLASVQQELMFLRAINQLNGAISADEPFSERGPVIDLFTNGRFNVLHIAAHGGFNALQPDDSRIVLDGGELRPADIFGRFGGARPRPLIFINACHGARLEHAFTGLGGWADRLVRGAKVGAFIGTAWEVNDRLALLFAQAFYEALLRDNRSIGESFLLARRRTRDADPSNSTWLAYVLYADPGAHAAPM